MALLVLLVFAGCSDSESAASEMSNSETGGASKDATVQEDATVREGGAFLAVVAVDLLLWIA